MFKVKYMLLLMLILIVFSIVACETLPLESEIEGSHSELLEATVTNIVDGDTFDAIIEGYGEARVRPILIDAPEICHSRSPADCQDEPFGPEATERATELLLGETIYLKRDVSEYDPFDRLLFYVYLEDGRMFQEILLEEGLAEVTPYPPDIKYQEQFEAIEQEARENQVGMWSQ